MNKFVKCAVLIGVFFSFSVLSGEASSIGLTFTPGNFYSPGQTPNLNAGWRFQADANITVVGLGVYDYAGDGFATGPHEVGLWDDLGNLLASATVVSTDILINSFRFENIKGVSLAAGQFYRVAAQMGDPNDVVGYGGPLSTDARISFDQGRFTYSSSLAFPTQSDGVTSTGTPSYFGANLLIDTASVPEPSSVLQLAAGLLVMLILSRFVKPKDVVSKSF